MKRALFAILFTFPVIAWIGDAFAACPTTNPQTIEAYVYGCANVSGPYSSGLLIPAVPSSTTAPTSSLETIPANTFLTLTDTQTATNKTLTSPTLGGSITLSGITGSTQCLQVNTSGVISGTG